MKIFVISLRSAHSRRECLRQQFADLGLSFEFFDAVTADEKPQDHFESLDMETFRLNTYRSPLASEIACYASHRELWKYACTNHEPIIILEDDAQLCDSFVDAVETTERLIGECGYIRLQPYRRDRPLRVSSGSRGLLRVNNHELRYLSKVPVCLLAYAISPVAAANLVRASATMDAPADKFIQRTWDHRTPIFDLSPAPVETSVHAPQSTIGSRSGKRKDLRTMLRRGRYKLLGEFRRLQFDRMQQKRFARLASPPTSGVHDLARGIR